MGNFSVVDGLQRLCTIFHFIDYSELNKATGAKLNPLRLEKLQYLKDLDDKNFSELDRSFQRRINELEIEANVIRSTTPKPVMFNVFARLNQGGLPLSAQEIRNAIYSGEWRKQIRNLSESDEFLSATERRIPKDRQQDMEMVLRFIALWALKSPFKREANQILDKFLNDTVEKRLTSWNAETWSNAQQAFVRGLTASKEVFGKHAFRKSSGNEPRTPVNKGIFESQMVTLSNLSSSDLELLIERRDQVSEKFGKLINNNESRLSKSLRSGTGHAESSNARVEELTKIYQEVLRA